MKNKYRVPALERAHAVLNLVSEEREKYTLSTLSRELKISKSTMYSLLQTLEELKWLSQNSDHTFSLGTHLGIIGNAFFEQYDLIDEFRKEAQITVNEIQESIQLAELDGTEVFYLDKVEYPSPVQMVSRPGLRLPAHATGLGKVLLSGLSAEKLDELFQTDELLKRTDFTISSKSKLLVEIEKIKKQQYALDLQEGVMGFSCIAAPIYQGNGEMIAAVSCSMPVHNWENKKRVALEYITKLANTLSL